MPNPKNLPAPPDCPKRPHELEAHGHVRVDPYYWIRDPEDPEILEYLTAENEYLESATQTWPHSPNSIFSEMRGRIKEEDQSVPYRVKDYWYRTKFEEGAEYPIFVRRGLEDGDEEEVILDVNELAAGLTYCEVVQIKVSEDQNLLAYAIDTTGRRLYEVRVRDLTSGTDLTDRIPQTSAAIAWSADDDFLFYVRQDVTTLRPNQLFRHRLGTDPAEDVLVFEETDETFHLTVYKTKSRDFIMSASIQTVSTEFRALEAATPTGEFRTVIPRERGHEYSVDHFGDHFYIRTNRNATNFRLVKAPVVDPSESHWEEVIPQDENVFFQGGEIFARHLVVAERSDALTRLRVIPWDGSREHLVDLGQEAYYVGIDINPEFDTNLLRYGYTSLTTPYSVFDYDLDTKQKTLLKQKAVLGDFDESNYVTRRLWAPARDGERIPISLVYRPSPEDSNDRANPDGGPCRPMLLYGYGSYGIDSDPVFQSSNLSLLDRGFVYAIAHVRGGEELGRRWYDAGRLGAKQNSFNDFIDVAAHLIQQGWTQSDRLFAMGGSAGGLLVGAVMNLAPSLFEGVVAAVPFVDVVTTMLDPTVPLTTGEYDEWGNPEAEQDYRTMLAYSPYDNVSEAPYPHLLVTSGLHDSQVQFWEPTKWVAKLRDAQKEPRLILLRTNLQAGHGGASGRFEALKERALEYAFLLALAEDALL